MPDTQYPYLDMCQVVIPVDRRHRMSVLMEIIKRHSPKRLTPKTTLGRLPSDHLMVQCSNPMGLTPCDR
jgi:hypothetical protein